jgi:hypothetical protein
LAQTTTELNAFRSNSLSKHNSYRATHRSPSMTTRSSANSTWQPMDCFNTAHLISVIMLEKTYMSPILQHPQ